jgi:cystathionine beta-lyase/cystathionine gamma-synthase
MEKSKLTLSVHAGSKGDPQFKGLATPLYPASAYDYEGMPTQYPRYYNTPNLKAVAQKVAALEGAEAGLMFSSGMSAIVTSLVTFLRAGDHVIFQNDLYGGTYYAVTTELPRLGIQYTMVDGSDPQNFARAVTPETKVIYIETPSNPTLKITDIKAVAAIAKTRNIITIIDSTFASPVNQNPIGLGIDVVAHSGTKYIGGHSDLCCGVVVTRTELMEKILAKAINWGGSPDANTAWLVERSLKTIVLRVRQQNANALALARWLMQDSRIGKVYYPGLEDHPQHAVAKAQMPGGFGGMLSFEVKSDPHAFMNKLTLIKRALSLGGVESTICSPMRTSHAKMTAPERAAIGVSDNLLRFSVGIEEANDLIEDIKQAL